MRRAQRVTAIIVVCIHQAAEKLEDKEGADYSCYDFIVQLTTEVARDVTKVGDATFYLLQLLLLHKDLSKHPFLIKNSDKPPQFIQASTFPQTRV